MIKKEEVLKYMKNLNFENDFYIKVLEYFIQELGKILKKPIKKDIENLRLFQFEFEKDLIPEDNIPENYLDKPILDLFLYSDQELSKKKLSKSLSKSRSLLKEYKN